MAVIILLPGMIDLHAHLLPGIDDGPASLEESIEMARVAAAAGTSTMAATPHIDRGFQIDGRTVAPAADQVQAALRQAAVDLTVVPGGELALDRAGDVDDDELAAVRLGGGPYLLAECPLTPHGGPIEGQIGALQLRGFKILLAHPERSPALQRDPGRLRDLVENEALCSVTAGAFTGQFGRPAKTMALAMLREGLVHSIDSDAHDPYRRPPGLTAGLAAAGLDQPAAEALRAYLTEGAPAAILAGEPLPGRPPALAPKRRLLGLRRAW
jgi:protein-tyrosine phosphatase